MVDQPPSGYGVFTRCVFPRMKDLMLENSVTGGTV
jgi:hypothetical protein